MEPGKEKLRSWWCLHYTRMWRKAFIRNAKKSQCTFWLLKEIKRQRHIHNHWTHRIIWTVSVHSASWCLPEQFWYYRSCMRFTGNLQRLSSGVAKETGQEYQLRP